MSQANNPCEGCEKECPNHGSGCKEWAERFVQNWNQNIHRCVPPMPRRVWQYEHPDRVREMAQEVADAQ